MSAPTLEDRLAQRFRPPGQPLLFMQWERLLFLHWAWAAEEIQARLPPGLVVDMHEGQAWVGVVPFFMRRVHPRGLPCLPWLSDFQELNVRTYVHDGQGVPGVWFFSLSCNQPVAVAGARTFFHLNYVLARMRAQETGLRTAYTSTRRGQEEAFYRYDMPAEPRLAEPGSLEFFLLERYVLFSADRKGRVYSGRVHHSPYQWGEADMLDWSFAPAGADGLTLTSRPPDHIAMSAKVDVAAWAIKRHHTIV